MLTFSFNLFSVDSSNAKTEENIQNSTNQSSEFASDKLLGDMFSDSSESSSMSSDSSDVSSNSGFGWAIFKIIIVLALIIAAIYGLMWFFKRKGNVYKTSDEFLRRVSTLNLGPGKSIEIITLLEKGYLLGVSDSNINLISEIDDKELIQALNLNFDKKFSTKKPSSFADVLDIFMPNGPRNHNSIYDEAEKKVSKIKNTENEGENE